VTVTSPTVSVGSGIGWRRADLHGRALGRRRRKAKRARKWRAVGVCLTSGHALPAGGGRRDARIREAQSVATPRAEAGAIRGAHAGLGAPQSTAREARIAGISLRDAGITNSQFAADRTLRFEARRELIEETDPVGRLTLAARGAPGGARAGLLAAEQVLALRARLASLEGSATARRRALGALRVARVDRAGARVCPAVGAAAATGDGRRAGRAIALARPELGRLRRGLRTSREDQPCERGRDGHEEGSLHSSIEASGALLVTTDRPGRTTLRRKRALALPDKPAPGMVPSASQA
jgi:hypothetical protein